MITVLKKNSAAPCQYCGLSLDDKPTDATENSLFLELDTNKLYYFTSSSWTEVGQVPEEPEEEPAPTAPVVGPGGR